MSRHSRNACSQSIFTYGERKKLKGQYGSKDQRIGQDSIKKFDMCTICSNKIIEPMCCDQGHIFCRTCAIQYLVAQKKKIQKLNQQAQIVAKKKEQRETMKMFEEKAKQAINFQKYDNFESVADRALMLQKQQKEKKHVPLSNSEARPTGIYDKTYEKAKYLDISFWATQNTPKIQDKVEKIQNIVKCPGSDHKLTLKKLRGVIAKEIQGEYYCGICSKEIGRQKIGSYRCGHLICLSCKSDKCELCDKKDGWIQMQSSSSAFSSHNKAQVKTYTHAFYL